MTSLASELPSDILRLIFELLDQPAVLSCAAVCHGWRATAVLDSSYYCALTLVFPAAEVQKPRVTTQRHTPGTTLDTLLQAVHEAEKCKYGISLTIDVGTDWEALNARLEDAEDPASDLAVQQRDWDVLQVEKELFPALPRAIPHLVRLDMQVEMDFARQLLPSFTVPAPLLRVLRVTVTFLAVNWEQPLPRDLFSGHTPLLTEVSLAGIQLRAPTPCFANARMLQFDSNTPEQLPAVISCFPRVVHLAFPSIRLSSKDRVSPEETAFFGRLRSLFVGRHINCSALAPSLPSIARIPDVELCAAGDVDALAEVLGLPAPDELVLSEHVPQEGPDGHFSHLRVQLHAPAATRRMNSCVQYDVTLRALGLSSAALSLTKLTVDDRHVRSLMQACPSMPLLEYLCVILIAWSAAAPWEPNQEIDCACPVHPFFVPDTRPPDETISVDYPCLRTLELRAMHARATIRADVLPALARCLGRVHLVLANGVFLESEVSAAFPSISLSQEDFVPSAETARVAVLLETAARYPERLHNYHCPHFPRSGDSDVE